MIKTLRITSVIAAILAGVFFVFPVIYGVRNDELVDEFLSSPSVKEKFESAADRKTKAGETRESPLVKQADAFAMYLNPPKTSVRKTSRGVRTPNIASKVAVTPKFKVFATTYYPENPELSQALIDEPGKGRYWVKQSSMVGHLLIEQVKDGLVVVKGSKETFELEIEQQPDTKTLNKNSSIPSTRSSQSRSGSTSPAFNRALTNVRRTTHMPQKPQPDIKDEEKMEELVDKLKDLQKSSVSDKSNSELDPEEQKERNARIQELISKFKSTRVSAEEAKKLGNMGEKLKDARKDANPSLPDANSSGGKVESPKSDKSDK